MISRNCMVAIIGNSVNWKNVNSQSVKLQNRDIFKLLKHTLEKSTNRGIGDSTKRETVKSKHGKIITSQNHEVATFGTCVNRKNTRSEHCNFSTPQKLDITKLTTAIIKQIQTCNFKKFQHREIAKPQH